MTRRAQMIPGSNRVLTCLDKEARRADGTQNHVTEFGPRTQKTRDVGPTDQGWLSL